MEDVPVPKPGPGEVLVKVTLSLKGSLIKKRLLRSGSPTVTTKVGVGEPTRLEAGFDFPIKRLRRSGSVPAMQRHSLGPKGFGVSPSTRVSF